MASNLLPERPLIFSPTLAATIGLDEAILLQVLMDFAAYRPVRLSDRYQWVELTDRDLEEALPFWNPADIRRVEGSLLNLGMILRQEEGEANGRFRFALNEQVRQTTSPPAAPPAPAPAQRSDPGKRLFAARSGASQISPDWLPGEEWLVQCRQHNIPDEFSLRQVPEFVSYWRDRGQARFSWGNAFFKHVLRSWRDEQSRRGAREQSSTMHQGWQPSPDAMEILVNAGIPGDFIEDAVPEFVLYWRERGVRISTWNTKFIEHIRRQWDRYSASFGQDQTPGTIAHDWQPSPACFEILQLAEIDPDFAREKVPEFVMYWRDSQQVRPSWNTVFLQFIKQAWARRLTAPLELESEHGKHQASGGESRHSVAEKLRQLTDRSWAETARRW